MSKKIVYRFLSKREFECWQKEDKCDISSPCRIDELPAGNNHKYVKGVRYVHFFDSLQDAPIVIQVVDMENDHLCKFAIDINTLEEHEGYGKYLDDNFDCVEVKEYAVPLDEIENNSLIEYRVVKNADEVKYINSDFAWEKIKAKTDDIEL